MRKRISICVVISIVISMFALAPVVSTAAEPVKVYDFYYEDQFQANSIKSENECVVEWKDNALLFTAATADSTLGDTYFYVGPGEAFETDENPWMVIKLKNLSDVKTFEMHYGTSLHTIKGDTVAHFPITAKDSEYKTYIVNIPQANLDTAYALNGPGGIAEQAGSTNVPINELTESTWEGTLTDLRFDCLYEGGASGLVPDGAQMQIEYAAFFANEADAKAYAQTGPDRSATHTAPPTVAPATGEDAKPNADVLIMFKEDGDWEDYIDLSSGPFNNMTFDDFNEAGDGVVYTIAKGGDPFACMNLTEAVDAEEWPVVQMKIKKQAGTPGSGSVYYATSTNPALGEAQFANFKYTSSTDWQIININMNEKNNGKCTGDYSIIRIDPFGDSPSENTFEIAYIAFFKTMEAAQGYTGDFSEILAAKPTAEPKTPAPATSTAKATSATTKTPSSTPKTNTSSGDSGLTTTQIIIIAVVAVVVIAAVVAIILIHKKKKAGKPEDPSNPEDSASSEAEEPAQPEEKENQEEEPKDSDDQGDQKE